VKIEKIDTNEMQFSFKMVNKHDPEKAVQIADNHYIQRDVKNIMNK